jgi:hypothetical protein
VTTTIAYGMTVTDRDSDYIPMMDGYRPGAEQDVVTFEVEHSLGQQTPEWWAEAVFVATNAPTTETVDARPGARLVADTIPPTRALSVGDTVTVDGIVVTCERIGWKRA